MNEVCSSIEPMVNLCQYINPLPTFSETSVCMKVTPAKY